MKRSDINRLMTDALALFQEHSFLLPEWATWSPAEWAANPDTAQFCHRHQMGWDITDFGFGDFAKRGLILFCIRNGIQGDETTVPYAEKIMVVQEEQETPLHYHKVKMEDIIVRGGGNLVVELYNIDDEGTRLGTNVTVRLDGMKRTVRAGEPVIIKPGHSITLPRNLYHRFYGEAGKGTVLVGEVSQVNDDLNDNFFYEDVGRFAEIEEDVPALYPLWSELPVAENKEEAAGAA